MPVTDLAVLVWCFTSWCQLFHQNNLNNVVVFVLRGMSQLHFYRFYLEFGFLRKAFRHVSLRTAWIGACVWPFRPENTSGPQTQLLGSWLKGTKGYGTKKTTMQSSCLQIGLVSDFLWDFRQNFYFRLPSVVPRLIPSYFLWAMVFSKIVKFTWNLWFLASRQHHSSIGKGEGDGRRDCFIHLTLRVCELVSPDLMSLGLHFLFCFRLLTSAYVLGPILIMLCTSPLILTVVL